MWKTFIYVCQSILLQVRKFHLFNSILPLIIISEWSLSTLLLTKRFHEQFSISLSIPFIINTSFNQARCPHSEAFAIHIFQVEEFRPAPLCLHVPLPFNQKPSMPWQIFPRNGRIVNVTTLIVISRKKYLLYQSRWSLISTQSLVSTVRLVTIRFLVISIVRLASRRLLVCIFLTVS